MVKSSFTLYRHTHFVAVGIFAMLMIAASAAVAVVRQSGAEHGAPEAIQSLGRFVVTPAGAHFEAAPAAEAATRE